MKKTRPKTRKDAHSKSTPIRIGIKTLETPKFTFLIGAQLSIMRNQIKSLYFPEVRTAVRSTLLSEVLNRIKTQEST